MLTDMRRAVGDSSVREIPRAYVRTGHASRDDVLELLVDRLVDYRAQVLQVTADGLADAVDQALNGVDSVVLPPGIDPVVRHASGRQERQVVVDGEPDVLTADQLDRIGAVVTRARVAIALSGTIILDDGPGQGRRALTLVPTATWSSCADQSSPTCRRVRQDRPDRPAHADLRPVRHQRHRADPGGGRARPPHADRGAGVAGVRPPATIRRERLPAIVSRDVATG